MELKSGAFKKETGFLLSYDGTLNNQELTKMFEEFDRFIENLFNTNSYYQYFSDMINVLIVPTELVDKYKELYLKIEDRNISNRSEIKVECIEIEDKILRVVSKDLNISE